MIYNSQNSVFIVDAVRTPVCNFNGALSAVPASQLGASVIQSLLQRNNISGSNISEIILGQVLVGGEGQNPARQASISAGIPHTVPAWSVSQVCGSGLRSVALGFQSISLGDNICVIAGGQENMSMARHATYLRKGIKMGNTEMIDMMIRDGLTDVFNNYHMGVTAENLAKTYNISRQEQDDFACASQNKAEAAQKSGDFDNEIIPVTITGKNGDSIVNKDEFIRSGMKIAELARLKPAFLKEGTVTAGNSSGINDGAAAVLMVNEAQLTKLNLQPMARIVSWAQAAVDPKIMGIGPVGAVNLALAKAGWSINELELIEANEAFAAQAIAVNRELKWNTELVNQNGGAIAIGHPIGASGARILVTLLHKMQKVKAKKAIATLCVGGGMGVAVCVEMV